MGRAYGNTEVKNHEAVWGIGVMRLESSLPV